MSWRPSPTSLVLLALCCLGGSLPARVLPADEAAPPEPGPADPALFAEVFDTHWQALADDYPYFELYGVDWQAEREEHRPRALAAADAGAFAWELARLLAALPDPHVEYTPPVDAVLRHWALPDLRTVGVDRRAFVVEWPPGQAPVPPSSWTGDGPACPELIAVEGVPATSEVVVFLAAGPPGSTLTLGLRWPDGSESEHVLRRPDAPNLSPPSTHFGERWLVVGRVGDVGYLRVRTFDPSKGTLGPDGKMTTMLRAALAELDDTSGLILDLQGNGGGLVAASDPFLGNLVERPLSYRWGNSGGKRRRITPRRPRYEGDVVVLVDEASASGGEWAARILRDAGRAVVVGGPSQGAEAAVQRSTAADGSVVQYSAWPMVEPGREPFQGRGVTLDHALPLTLEAVRALGVDGAREQVRRARLARALELLGGAPEQVDALYELFLRGELPRDEPAGDQG